MVLTSGTVDDIGAPQGQDGNGAYGGINSDSIVNAFTYGDNLTWQHGKADAEVWRTDTALPGEPLLLRQRTELSASSNSNGSVSNFLQDQVTKRGTGAP